ncbi:MAG: MCE family protein [Planctomycetales bacterium]|nr:MCE family protein [Planctomycetales bacterium]
MPNKDALQSNDESALPLAVMQEQRGGIKGLGTRLWWLTLLCAVVAIALVANSLRQQGPIIRIRFQSGHGIKPGDTLRYRGIDVGEITEVHLVELLDNVEVTVQLLVGHESLAVEGSQFWIERPQVRLGQVRGLDTVLGAKYLSVMPGPPGSNTRTEFIGSEYPLMMPDGEGVEVRVRFPAGEGLEVGDVIRYLGTAVGEVSYVEISEELDAVWVGMRLVGPARSLARQGTQFWIERPRLDVSEIRGLDTLLTGRYIAVQPTRESGDLQTQFVGLSEPPPLPRREGSLEIELDAGHRMGLVRGAPIMYRGLEVGRVANVDLTADGASVRINVVIDADYAELVRVNSRWWILSGIRLDAGLSGVQLSVDSISSWLRGGIAFATPDEPGAHVVTGHRFSLAAEPEKGWLDWQPRIALEQTKLGKNIVAYPKAIKVVASWHGSILGLYRRHTVETWGLGLVDGRLAVPKKFIDSVHKRGNSPIVLEVGGVSAPFESEAAQQNKVAYLKIPIGTNLSLWKPESLMGNWDGQATLLVINPELGEPLALDRTRLTNIDAGEISIAIDVSMAPELEGSPVLESSTGTVVGLLVQEAIGWRIAKF